MVPARLAVASLGLVCACFRPIYDHPACPGGQCPDGLICSAQGICEKPGALIDGGFDHALCPASYNAELPGPSLYRLVVDGHPAWEHSDACAADLPGATHLVVLETQRELSDVVGFVVGTPVVLAGNSIWVGAVQLLSATAPADKWLWFDGEPLTSGWLAIEPNDRDHIEADHEEQFIQIAKDYPGFNDIGGASRLSALCECDGKPLAQDAYDAIMLNRPR